MSAPYLLGDLEMAVMASLWARGPGDVKQLHDQVGAPRGITLNTVQSTLKRLHGKGLLTRRKVSHAYIYAPARTRAEFQRDALDEVVRRVMDGRPDAMLSAFVDLAERAGPDLLERLEQLVAARIESGGDDE